MVTMEEYWVGKGVEYDRLWDAYDDGVGYIEKIPCDGDTSSKVGNLKPTR